eukprot:COSAG01_NODE_39044_length_481_cov_8.465969_2_plen_64_part_01
MMTDTTKVLQWALLLLLLLLPAAACVPQVEGMTLRILSDEEVVAYQQRRRTRRLQQGLIDLVGN